MHYREHFYVWEWDLESSPEALWDFVSDTNRFDSDAGLPHVELLEYHSTRARRARFSSTLVTMEWEEEPFEWVRPHHFGGVRRYRRGPFRQLRFFVTMQARPGGGTHLVYRMWIIPKNVIGLFAASFLITTSTAQSFDRVMRQYDETARTNTSVFDLPASKVEFAPGGQERLDEFQQTLLMSGVDRSLVRRLVDLIRTADELTLARLRPYALADYWGVSRRQVLELFLWATRVGMLEFQWELLCPLCRGAPAKGSSLGDMSAQVHCDTCHIDFTANFDQSVELTFRVHSSVRPTQETLFCVGNPQQTPHIFLQHTLESGATVTLQPHLDSGRYRIRVSDIPGGYALQASEHGAPHARIIIDPHGWPEQELHITTRPALTLINPTSHRRQVLLERMAWSDQAATAAEVTALQVFRDLFTSEALRPGERITVGNLTVLFTDLRQSTQMYRNIGDATAFGVVMNHFDVLKQIIAEEEGAIVKTIGDAVMAVFRRPIMALRASLRAQYLLSHPPEQLRPLALKVGINTGNCIAVTLNEHLDYFGSTVNIAARLTSLSDGTTTVIAQSVHADPEVCAFLQDSEGKVYAEPFVTTIRGFDREHFDLWRVWSNVPIYRQSSLGGGVSSSQPSASATI